MRKERQKDTRGGEWRRSLRKGNEESALVRVDVQPDKHPRQVFTAALFQVAPKPEASEMRFSRCWTHRLWNIIQQREETSHGATTSRGGTLNAYGSVKEANPRRLHTVWLQRPDIGKRQNYGDSR